MSDVTIRISKNGPLLIKERVQVIDQATGEEIAIAKFPIALCRCGRSATKPFCDGSHNSGDFDGTLNPPK